MPFDDDMPLMVEDTMMKKAPVISKAKQIMEYSLYLNGEINGQTDYLDHYAVFNQASGDDLVRLYISSIGGDVAAGIEYIRHMEECQCPIIAVVGFGVASMAATIVMACDDVELYDESTMLIHSVSYSVGGMESKIHDTALFIKKMNKRIIEKYYKDFLTEQEKEDIYKGVDVLLDVDDLVPRFAKLRKKKDEESNGYFGMDSFKDAIAP